MAVHGEFDLTATTPDGPRASHMAVDIDTDTGVITGTITADGQTAPILEGHITAPGEATFKVHVTEPAPMDLIFKSKCDDEACTTVTGTVTAPGIGEFPIKGKRT